MSVLDDFDLLGGMDDDAPAKKQQSPARAPQDNYEHRGPRAGNSDGHDYTRQEGINFNGDEARVNELLSLRIGAKRKRDFDTADMIRDELLRDHGVQIWDKDRIWTVVGSSKGPPMRKKRHLGGEDPNWVEKSVDMHDYSREMMADDDVVGTAAYECDVAQVDAMLTERLNAKFSGDFSKADDIRDQLAEIGVRVHDGSRVWRAGVDTSAADPWTRVENAYSRTGMRDNTAANINEVAVQKLIAERSVARRRRYWQRADEILDSLLYDHGVEVDDESRTWRAISTEYTCDDDASSMPAKAAIERLISIRACCKMRRRYDEADSLREELTDTYGVQLDDKKRSWRLTKKSA